MSVRPICSLNRRHGHSWACQGRDDGVRRGKDLEGGQWVVTGVEGDGPQGREAEARPGDCCVADQG